MAKKGAFAKSWEIIRKHKILFFPNIFILATNFILLVLFLYLSGLGSALLNNQQIVLEESFSSWKFLLLFVFYLLANALIDNFFFAAKYGMIKDVLLKKGTSLTKGWKFARKYYWTTLGIHVLSLLIIIIPMLILAVLMLSLLPVSALAAATIFLPLLIAYAIYITIRLLFVYPVMAFERKGAYKSLEEDFHFVKNHLSHTFMTWLVVLVVSIIVSIFRTNVSPLSSLLSGQLFFMGLLAVVLILGVELVVSVWEQVYIFSSYFSAHRSRKKTLINLKKLLFK